MNKVFFIADSHFGHENIIRYEQRIWRTVEEMDAAMIELWNRQVDAEDDVYVLGDLCHCSLEHAQECLCRLNGKLHLIRGNHDLREAAYERYFTEVCDYKELPLEKVLGSAGTSGDARTPKTPETSGTPEDHDERLLILSHYFMPFFHRCQKGAIHLYGHTHNTPAYEEEEKFKRSMCSRGISGEAYNIGALYLEYKPQPLDWILKNRQ